MARNASIISYLFFAYDSLIFCKNDEADAKAVSDIFNMYQQALGQKINLEKSEIMLICKVETRLKKVFQDWLPIKETSELSSIRVCLLMLGDLRGLFSDS
jgi:hypothetical protein